jgi:phosphoglycolate phosphatase-like HAD superfamily hydrolase
MVRLVLFDIDGTLVHTGGAGMKAFAKVFTAEFKAADGCERLKFAGRTDLGLVRQFFGFHAIPPTPENFQRFFDHYVFWLDHLLQQSQTQLCPGVWEFLAGLQALPQPPTLGLLTGNIRLGAEIKLRHFQLWDVFQTGAFGDEHEDRNRIAVLAQERGRRVLGTELSGNEILVIGDTPLDICCARAIGAKCLAVATGGHPLAELELHQPDWAVKDLHEITAAKAVVGGAEG